MSGRARLPRRGKFIANERLRALREERNISQAQLAELAEPPCSQADIQRLETGNARTTTEWQIRLAPALGVDPRDLSPLAAGPARLSDGGMDADILAHAMAIARRWGRDDEPWIPAAVALFYNLLARERDGQSISLDDEATLILLDVFARRMSDIFASR